MLLNSILLISFLASIVLNNLKIILVIFFLELFLNIFFNKNLKKNLKKIKFLVIIYLGTFLIQIFSMQEGEVLFKIGNIYITKDGLENITVNFLRIINLIMMSWLLDKNTPLFNIFGKYKKITEDVIELVPEVFVMFRNKMKLKSFFKHILKKIKI